VPTIGHAATEYVPGIKIVLEVRTCDGHLRSFQRPGSPPTYWAQDLPVVQGDQVTINPMIATGGAELAQVKIRLDQTQLADRTERPWRVQVNTSDLAAGYHLIEVWAITKPPGAKQNSATTTFLVVPQNDPLLRMVQGEGTESGPPVSDEERLSGAIRSRDPKVDQEIRANSSATVTGPTLFFVSAGPAAKEFFYTLTREDRVTYTSPRLPVQTHVLLEPQQGEAPGEASGTLVLTMRVGDGAGRFGPPAWVTVHIKPPEAAK
jgi:hypothetical protein